MKNYYEIEITGNKLKKFYTKIIKNNIEIFDVKTINNKIVLKCSYENYQKIKKINYFNKVRIIKIHGIKKIKYLLKKYDIFLIFFSASILILYILSKNIFIININTNNEELKNEIKENLKEENIKIYSFQKNVNELNKIENNIKNNLKDEIEWIEIKNRGVYLDVNIIERIKEEKPKEEKINDIIASENGYILDIYSKKGEILKFKGDYVKKGDVIISGNIYRNENIISQVSAKGDVYAKVWYIVKVNANMKYNEKINKQGYVKIYLNILGKNIKLLQYKKNIKEKQNKTIIDTYFLTLKIKKDYIKEEINKKYQQNEIKDILKEKAINKIKDTLNEKEYIMEEKTLKSYIKNDRMYMEIFFEVYKNIAKEKEINLIEKEE